MEEPFFEPDLQPFGFDTIVQNGQQVGNGLIRPVGIGSKAERSGSFVLLRRLIDEILHIRPQHADLVAGERHHHVPFFAIMCESGKRGKPRGSLISTVPMQDRMARMNQLRDDRQCDPCRFLTLSRSLTYDERPPM